MKKILRKIPLLILTLLIPFFTVMAQSGDATMPSNATETAPIGPRATSTPATATTSTLTMSTTSAPSTIVPRPKPRPAPALPILVSSSSIGTSSAPTSENPNSMLWLIVASILIIPSLAYLAFQSLKNKKTKEENSRCFDIKQLVDKKLRELADLKGQLKDKVEEKARDGVREVLQGTSTGEMLVVIEKAEEEYARLEKLYEECLIGFEKRVFKGVLIENSLRDKKILDEIKIEKTRQLEDWIIHDVEVDEDKISELSENLAEGPWYVHLWEEGKDEIKIIFKNKTFTIKSSDKTTWSEAIFYGKSIGIPEEQLDFKRDHN